jgi:hypothetical protein
MLLKCCILHEYFILTVSTLLIVSNFKYFSFFLLEYANYPKQIRNLEEINIKEQ